MPKTLGIWEWGCPKRGDAQNAVTAGRREPWEGGCFSVYFPKQLQTPAANFRSHTLPRHTMQLSFIILQ